MVTMIVCYDGYVIVQLKEALRQFSCLVSLLVIEINYVSSTSCFKVDV